MTCWIDGAYKIFNAFREKYPNNYKEKLKAIKNFFLNTDEGKELYTKLNRCPNDDHEKRITKSGLIKCYLKTAQLQAQEKQKKRVKRTDCSDYVYSSDHNRCVPKSGKMYGQLTDEKRQIADGKPCNFKSKKTVTKSGVERNYCAPSDEKEHEQLMKQWNPKYKAKKTGKTGKRKTQTTTRTAAPTVEKLKVFMDKHITPESLQVLSSHELIDKIKDQYSVNQVPDDHAKIIRNYLLAKAAYLKLTDQN